MIVISEARLEWFEGIGTYGSLVEATVFGVWFYCVGKKKGRAAELVSRRLYGNGGFRF